MLSALFVATFLLFPILFFLCFKRLGLDLTKVTLSNVVVWNMLLSAYVGLIVLFFGWDEYRVSVGVTDQFIIIKILLLAMCAYTSLGFGLWVGLRCFPRAEHSIVSYAPLRLRTYLFITIVSITCLFVLLKYLAQIDQIALISLLMQDGDVHFARSEMGNNFSGKFHWYRLFFREIPTMLLFLVFADYLRNKQPLKLVLLLVMFLFVSFGALMATEKGPMAWLLVGLFVVYIVVNKRRRIDLGVAVFGGGFVLFMLGLMYILFMGSGNPFLGVMHALGRVTAGSIHPVYHFLELENEFGLLYGQTMPNPRGVLPFEPFSLSKEVWALKFPDAASKGLVGSMPAVFWAEMYLNFSYLGVVLVSFLVGVALKFIETIILLLPGSAAVIALEVWLLMHYKDLAVTGVGAFIADIEAPIIIFLALLIVRINRIKRTRYSGLSLVQRY